MGRQKWMCFLIEVRAMSALFFTSRIAYRLLLFLKPSDTSEVLSSL